MKKNIIFFLVLGILIFQSINTKTAYCDNICNVYSFTTDKINYYYLENINIIATWETDYDYSVELIYVQIRLIDLFENIKWNSSEYIDIGLLTQNWTINIQGLNLTMLDNPCSLYLKFYRHYHNHITGEDNGEYLESITINVAKNDIICELDGFANEISYGDSLEFTAKFFYMSNSSALVNQNIRFKVITFEIISFLQDFTSNQDGLIFLNISTLNNLIIGNNILQFEILNSQFFNNSIFNYSIFISRLKIYTDVVDFNENLVFDDEIKLIIKFYYINNTIQALTDQEIYLYVYQNSTLVFEQDLRTNSTGYINAFLKVSDFNLNNNFDSFSIYITYNGTNFLENSTILFQVTISKKNPTEILLSLQMIMITTCSILGFAGLAFFLIKRNRRDVRNLKLKDIVFKF